MNPDASTPLPPGTWQWDFAQDAMTWDDAMHALFGLPPGTFEGDSDHFFRRILDADRSLVAQSMSAAVESGMDYEGELRVLWPDDSRHVLLMRGSAERDESGRIRGMRGTCEMLAAASGRTTEMERIMLTALMDHLPDFIYFKDMNHRITAISQAHAQWFGVSNPKALIGKTDLDLFTEEHARQTMQDERDMLETGRPLINMEEKETWPDGHVTYVSTSKMPLRDARGQIIGTFGLSRDITERKHAEKQLAQLAEELRHRNEVLEEELTMARELQLAMLPQGFPAVVYNGREALRFHHFFKPSSTVSGDFFDVYELSETRVGIFICDVMGHGVGASLIAATVRALMDEWAPRIESPGALLAELNNALRRVLRNTSTTFFVTACYLTVDLQTGQLTYANAGHPRPIRVGAEAAALNGDTGPVLGLFDGAAYTDCTCPFATGDKVFLFTDGLFEVENPQGESFDYDRLLQAAAAAAAQPLEACTRAMVEAACQFSGMEEFDDDVCLLGMELA